MSTDDLFAPPLKVSAQVSELVARHYLKGRHANKHGKVAWVTSGAPVEFLKALNFYLLYPENHAAVCGARKMVVDISSAAEEAGYSREICSYARTDIGAMLSGKTPVGKLPKPDLLVASTNICQTVIHWYRVLAHHFNVPFILIDAPFIYTHASDHAIEFVKRQIEESIPIAEAVAGKSLDEENLQEVVRLSRAAMHLLLEILERCQHHPAPISVFDQFIFMAPIVEMRGDAATVEVYAAIRDLTRKSRSLIG